jgi:heme/copper-type cytochrome/quinol oxidase subunit 4
MKTLISYDLRIQQTLLILFLTTILAIAVTQKDFLYISIFVEFFLIAFVQYSLNITKFLSKEYLKTDSRKVYIFVSTYIVITFLLFIIFHLIKIEVDFSFFEWIPISWIILSPVLMIQSLVISFYDKEDNKTIDHA